MSRDFEQQRDEIAEAVQALIGEMDDFVHHKVADGVWQTEGLTEYELRLEATNLAQNLARAADKVLAAAAVDPQNFEGNDE